ncbi:MAG: hypothetical protein WCT77_11295 [Bacteroidota bacterium]
MYKPNKSILIVALIIAFFVVGWLYRDSFTSYFFQDDWFTFKISSVSTVEGIITFFKPRTDVIYYRPLGMQIPFFVMGNIFGFNPLPYRILTYVIIMVSSSVVFIMSYQLTKNQLGSILAAFLYATSATHYIPMYWFSTFPFVLGPLLFFLSVLFIILYSKSGVRKYYLLSIIAFLLGLFTYEIIAVVPLVLVVYYLLFNKTLNLGKLIPFFIGDGVLILIKFVLFPASAGSIYSISFNRQTLVNLYSYVLWIFNWPEEMKAQMIRFMTFNPVFVSGFRIFVMIFTIGLSILFISLIIIPVITILKSKSNHHIRLCLLGLWWFIVGLLPVLLFPYHTYSYYLPVSLAGILIPLCFGATSITTSPKYRWVNIISTLLIIGVWVTLTATTIQFNKNIYWAPQRAKISERLVMEAINEKYDNPSKTKFNFPSGSENKLSLNDQDALQVIFHDPSVITEYGIGIQK